MREPHNGYTNYETWLTSLHLADIGLTSGQIEDCEDLEALVLEYLVNKSIECDSFQYKAFKAFLSWVNWDDIVRNRDTE